MGKLFTEHNKNIKNEQASHSAVKTNPSNHDKDLEIFRYAVKNLAEATEVPEVLQQIVKCAKKILDSDYAVLWPYDPSRMLFNPKELEAEGLNEEELETIKKCKSQPARPGGTAEKIINSKSGYLKVTDVHAPKFAYISPSKSGLREELGVQAFQAIALKTSGDPLGVLYLYYLQPRDFNNWDKNNLKTLTFYASSALKKARLLEQVRKVRNSARIAAKVSVLYDLNTSLQTIADGTKDAINCDAVTLYTYDESRGEIGFPPAMSGVKHEKEIIMLGEVRKTSVVWKILSREDHYIADNAPTDKYMKGNFIEREKIVTSIGVPLNVGNRKVGVMFFNYRTPHHFIQEELNDIKLFADQAAVTISNVQLLDETNRRKAYLEVLINAGKDISSSLDLDEILSNIAEYAWRFTSSAENEASFSNIAVLNNHTLNFRAAYPPHRLKELKKHISEINLEKDKNIGFQGQAVVERKPIRISDVTQKRKQYNLFEEKTKSELVCPIIADNNVLGVINIEHPDVNAFNNDDESFLKALASQAGIAIRNSFQYLELKRVKGLIGARTALAWMGMASSAWRHSIGNQALDIYEQIELLRRDLKKKIPTNEFIHVDKRLFMIQELARLIMEKPITPPLSNEEGVVSVFIDDLIRKRTQLLWEKEPYKSVKLILFLSLNDQATIRASPEWLLRMFDILVDNSIKAIGDSNKKEITIETIQKNSWIKIIIGDNGSGIPIEISQHLFKNPIKLTKGSSGLGMGLLIAQAIVQTYNGEIGIESTSYKGTKIYIQFPLET